MPLTDAELSRLLFACREYLTMYADVMASSTRAPNVTDGILRTRDEVDAYRVSRGWQLDGFGGE